MKKVALLICLIFPFTLSAQALSYNTIQDLPYYDQSKTKTDQYLKDRAVLDIYYPKNKKGFATLIWFHGGGLTGGNKEILEGFKTQGIAVVAVNYRLVPKVNVSQCIEDAAAAVAWTFRNIPSYGGAPSLIFVSGHSAGGYLSLMLALEKKWLKTYDIDANAIAGIIPLSGHTITHFERRKELGLPDTQPLIDEMAPLYHVRADAPPLLLITGDRELELLGRYEENAYLMRMMKVKGHTSTRLLELDGYDHGMVTPALPLVIKEIERISSIKQQSSK